MSAVAIFFEQAIDFLRYYFDLECASTLKRSSTVIGAIGLRLSIVFLSMLLL